MKQLKYNTPDNDLIWERLTKPRIVQEGAGWATIMGTLYTGGDTELNKMYGKWYDHYKDKAIGELKKEYDAVRDEVAEMEGRVQKHQEQQPTQSAGPVSPYLDQNNQYSKDPGSDAGDEIYEIKYRLTQQRALGELYVNASNEARKAQENLT